MLGLGSGGGWSSVVPPHVLFPLRWHFQHFNFNSLGRVASRCFCQGIVCRWRHLLGQHVCPCNPCLAHVVPTSTQMCGKSHISYKSVKWHINQGNKQKCRYGKKNPNSFVLSFLWDCSSNKLCFCFENLGYMFNFLCHLDGEKWSTRCAPPVTSASSAAPDSRSPLLTQLSPTPSKITPQK